MSWTKGDSHVESWEIQYTEKNRDNWISEGTVASNVVQESIERLTSGANYTIRIFAVTYDDRKSRTATVLDATVGKYSLFH